MLLRRAWTAVKARPHASDYADLAVATFLFGSIAAVVGSTAGLSRLAPREAGDIVVLAARALVIPAFSEELIFRAMLVPSRAEMSKPLWPIALSVTLFTLWHVVETLLLPAAAATFLRADFLSLAALLGLSCAVLRWRSGSIWTAVIFHWLAVLAWQGWFGGPSFGSLV